MVAGIVPWNYPQTLSSFKYAPALAAGNTIVLKPSPETVPDSYVFAEAVIAADLPPGVVNIHVFAAFASSLPVGDALDPSTLIGPLVAERQRDRVERYIAKGVSDGARLVTGGGRPAHLDAGWFVEPTIFADVDNRSTIAQEEIFGPARARRVVRRVRTGTMGINGYLPDPAGPWGGVKSSGLGRELGPGAIAAYQNLKTVYA